MRTLRLNDRSANAYVAKTPTARWDGWDIVLFTPSESAWHSPSGVFDRRHNAWGFEKRVKLTDKGFWFVNVVAH